MFEKVVIATDLSSPSYLLLECLEEFKSLGTVEANLTHVFPNTQAYKEGQDVGHSLRLHLEKQRQMLLDQSFIVHTPTPIGDKAQELISLAKSMDAMIIIGSRGKSFFRDLLLGSTVKDVIRKTPVPTLIERINVAPKEDTLHAILPYPKKLKHIMLATDMSDGAEEAKNVALKLAPHAEKIILTCIIEEAQTLEATREVVGKIKERLANLHQQFAPSCKTISIRTDIGSPADKIISVAKEEEATLIVMGTRGIGHLKSVEIGRTAWSVSVNAKQPVLLIPPYTANETFMEEEVLDM